MWYILTACALALLLAFLCLLVRHMRECASVFYEAAGLTAGVVDLDGVRWQWSFAINFGRSHGKGLWRFIPQRYDEFSDLGARKRRGWQFHWLGRSATLWVAEGWMPIHS